MVRIDQSEDAVSFAVKVHPRARRERISGALGDALKLEITAPPLEGKANAACVRFFANLLKVPRSSVTIAAGISSRNKVIRITGVSAHVVKRVFATALDAANAH